MRQSCSLSLPTRNGVGPGCIVLPTGPWAHVLDFLNERFTNVTREEIEARMTRGDVIDELGNSVLPTRRYTPNLKLYYYRSIAVEEAIPFDEEILFQDEQLVVVDKPHFLPVIPSGRYLQQTLLIRLIRKLGIDTLAPMHRLDRETAGVMIFTVQPHLRGHYQQLFARREVTKHYQAIAPYRPELSLPLTRRSRLVPGEPFMRMQEIAGAEIDTCNAETQVELLETLPCGQLGRYRLTPFSGKKHQLRVHMAALGIPIVNDKIYPVYQSNSGAEKTDYSQPLQLLAEAIAFNDPVTGERRHFSSRRQLQPA